MKQKSEYYLPETMTLWKEMVKNIEKPEYKELVRHAKGLEAMINVALKQRDGYRENYWDLLPALDEAEKEETIRDNEIEVLSAYPEAE